MFGTGLGHYIPLVAYVGFWVMVLMSLGGKPLIGLYYAMPFVPYRTLRDKFLDYPLGGNMLTILVIAIIVGGVLHGKKLPKSKLYGIWLLFAVYLYFSMWFGMAVSGAPAPLWLSDFNFVTWKDYMMLPLMFVAAGLVVEDRRAVRNVVIVMAISLAMIDRSTLLESLSRSWTSFDESKRDPGPLAWGSNQLAAFLAQFGMFFWGFGRILKRRKVKLLSYGLVAATIMATMYTFSRASYLALLVSVALLAFLKDRKLLLVLPLFLLFWQAIVPTAVTERVQMTKTADGQLEASAAERVQLWQDAKESFYRSPLLGNGFSTFVLGEHVDDLKDTHNWYVKVLVETGVVGGIIALWMLIVMVRTGYRLFRTARDPLYQALGLGCLLATCSCLVANGFGDRWTYLEINGLLWVLMATAARAQQLTLAETAVQEETTVSAPIRLAPSLEWR
ncbi:MAG TPA: O-antigen ligase family protein [Acidobacteriaceae bacterium]|nr:O-antigen ligase family protein [Acidobacteriaceae bacterium]